MTIIKPEIKTKGFINQIKCYIIPQSAVILVIYSRLEGLKYGKRNFIFNHRRFFVCLYI